MRPRRRRFFTFWTWLAGFILLLLFAHMTAISVTGRMIENEIRRIRQRGEPVSARDIAPPSVPDEQNAARVYERALLALPSDQEFKHLGRALFRSVSFREPLSDPKARQIVWASEPAIRLLEQAANMPRCSLPIEPWRLIGVLPPQWDLCRKSDVLLLARALIRAEKGDSRAALADIATALAMADHFRAQPWFISEPDSVSRTQRLVRTLNRVVQVAPPSRADCRRIYDLLATIDHVGPARRLMQGHRALLIWSFDKARKEGWVARDLEPGQGKRSGLRLLGACVAEWAWWPLLNLDELSGLRTCQKGMLLADRPYSQLLRESAKMPWYAVRSRDCIAFSVGYYQQAVARTGLAQWGLALEVYRHQVGTYPNSLRQVRSTVGWRLPKDPYSGKDFIYRRKGAGYILYSVGFNQRDDGSIGHDDERGPRRPECMRLLYARRPGDDIAWGMPPE